MPFPYPGGKSTVADVVWAALGPVRHYIEPFVGSGAVLLGRRDKPFLETVCDADHLLVNVWRSIRFRPDEVAYAVVAPVAAVEASGRAKRLRSRTEAIKGAIRDDPDACDPVAAADWIYCACALIGSDMKRLLDQGAISGLAVHRGHGVNAVHIGGPGQGVNAVHIGNPGQGVNAVHIGDPGQGVNAHLQRIAARIARLRICSGDWTTVLTEAVLTATPAPIGVFLDPPYAKGGWQYGGGMDGAHDVAEWCRKNQDHKGLRIVLAGEVGDYDLPGWRTHLWKRNGGFANASKPNTNERRDKECLWMSPQCLNGTGKLYLATPGLRDALDRLQDAQEEPEDAEAREARSPSQIAPPKPSSKILP